MRTPIVAAVSLAFMSSIVVPPAASLADPLHAGVGGHAVMGGGPVHSQSFASPPFVQHPFSPRPFVSRPFVDRRPFVSHPFVERPFGHHHFFEPFAPFGAVVVYSSPAVVYGEPTYYDPSAYYDQPAAYYDPTPLYGSGGGTVSVAPPPPPPPPPTPSVVEYPTGRFELRGDGITIPYTWVWIPNPPPPPPAAPPAAPSASADASQPRHSQLYRWTDQEGVAHWTDRLDAVPGEYRKEAKKSLL